MTENFASVSFARLLRERFGDAILTTAPTRRRVLAMWATSVVSYALYAAVGVAAAATGVARAPAIAVLIAAMLVINAAFYICFRLGVARDWARDRDLGVTQLLIGIVFMWFTYAVIGPAAPATLIVMATHVVYAMFTMSPERVRRLVVFSLGGIAATMIVSWRIDPTRYPIRVQLIGLAFAVIALPLIGRLASQVTSMSDRLRSQHRELAAALDQVRLMASSDDLTKAHNRRHMLELMHRERVQMVSDVSLCVALLDIDLFKTVNDRFGHAVGDDVLRRFATEAKRVLRPTDLFARWGGEEFMAMFVGISIDDAEQILNRMRGEVSRIDFGFPDLVITFSAGLVDLLPDELLEDAIERADQEMYHAKSSGRNQVCRPCATFPGERTVSISQHSISQPSR